MLREKSQRLTMVPHNSNLELVSRIPKSSQQTIEVEWTRQAHQWHQGSRKEAGARGILPFFTVSYLQSPPPGDARRGATRRLTPEMLSLSHLCFGSLDRITHHHLEKK